MDRTTKTVIVHDKLVVLGDFSGGVGSDHCGTAVLVTTALGNAMTMTSSSWAFAASTNSSLLTLYFVSLPEKENVLDYLLTRSKDRRDAHISRSMPDADVS